ncbi:MAG TPA: hypothetical protein VLJ10_03720 [Candidatus Bathyarchaeia archaeon]|nr:hypothetical protein [Candidatus Bathyarchaeia archaeon]
MCGNNEKKGFFSKLVNKMDKKMKEKAASSSCCCCGPQDPKKDKGKEKDACC